MIDNLIVELFFYVPTVFYTFLLTIWFVYLEFFDNIPTIILLYTAKINLYAFQILPSKFK
jgi:hypothetical protein